MADISPQKNRSGYTTIYNLVRQVPAGHVTTYGQIAQQAGCTARTVGFAMAALPAGSDVPWQRVINSQGKISPRTDGEGNILQRDLLEMEGISFDRKGKVDLHKYHWNAPGNPKKPSGNKRTKYF